MAMRKRDLVGLGGFRRVGAVLAEDHVLGRLFVDAGFALRTALETVENRNVTGGLRRTIERHTRWAKMRRAISPGAFLLEPLLSPLVVATAMAALFPTRTQVAAAVVALVLQTAAGLLAVRVLRGRALPWLYAPLEIVRTYVALACWASALASRRVAWRGHAFVLGKDSALLPVPEGDDSRNRIGLAFRPR
jgi:ceramide glucosyltransferase